MLCLVPYLPGALQLVDKCEIPAYARFGHELTQLIQAVAHIHLFCSLSAGIRSQLCVQCLQQFRTLLCAVLAQLFQYILDIGIIMI